MDKVIKETLNYYDENAKTYFDSTVKANMEETYYKFLRHIKMNGYILDFGCGSGRDSKYFIDNGYKVKAIDGSLELCKLASIYIGKPVIHQNFLELDDENIFDGIWACSSILHLPPKDLLKVLRKMIDALKNNGWIYTCFKNGDGEEILNGRYFNYLTKEKFVELLELFPELKLEESYETKSVTNINEVRYWNNFFIKKRIKDKK